MSNQVKSLTSAVQALKSLVPKLSKDEPTRSASSPSPSSPKFTPTILKPMVVEPPGARPGPSSPVSVSAPSSAPVRAPVDELWDGKAKEKEEIEKEPLLKLLEPPENEEDEKKSQEAAKVALAEESDGLDGLGALATPPPLSMVGSNEGRAEVSSGSFRERVEAEEERERAGEAS